MSLLPATGASREDVLRQLHEMKANDVRWRDGRAGLVLLLCLLGGSITALRLA